MHIPHKKNRSFCACLRLFGVLLIGLLGLGCSIIGPPKASIEQVIYTLEWQSDPLPTMPMPNKALPAMNIQTIVAPEWLRQNKTVYSLDFLEANRLRQYAYSRWSSDPAQLLHQSIVQRLYRHFNVQNSSNLSLRLDLIDFRQHFKSATQSFGRLHIYVTLNAQEKILARQEFLIDCAAKTADGPGGVAALTESAKQFETQLTMWLMKQLVQYNI